MSKIASLRLNNALLWGFACSAALMNGCAGHPRTGAGVHLPEQVVAATEADAMPDYATRLAEWVEAHQSEKESRNRWQEFFEVATAVCAAWEYFALSNLRIVEMVQRNPDANYGAADPGLGNVAQFADLVPELRGFFAVLEKSRWMDRMDELAGPSRFVALRAVDLLVTTSMPELGRARLCARICAARMRLAAMDGRFEQVVRSLRHALAMARAVQGRGLMVGASAASAAVADVEREVCLELLDGRLDAPACAEVLRVLTDTPLPDIRMAIGGERFFVLESIELFFDQTEKEAAPGTPALRAGTAERDSGEATAPRAEQIAQAERFFRAADGLFGADEAARGLAGQEVAAVERIVGNHALPPFYKPLESALPSVRDAMRADRRVRMHHEGVRIMLALELFRARKGHYPGSLAELVPGEIERVPADPFAETRAMGYRRMDASGTDALRAYVLYSVGTDGEDNGGRVHPTNAGNASGGGAAGRGYDSIINARVW